MLRQRLGQTREAAAVSRGGGTASLPCPIINAPNRNEAALPALTCQDCPIEVMYHCIYHFGSSVPRSSAMVSSSREYVTELHVFKF